MQDPNSNTLTIWSFEAPASADPILYDAGVHHLTFTAVFSHLVTQYSRGRFTGILAESWSISSDLKEWKFNLRKGLTFSDGSPITPTIILNNFKRIAFLMAKKGSHSDLFNNLKDYTPPQSPSDDLEGLTLTDDGNLTIFLARPVPNLLEVLGFGLFGLIHPSNFNSINGEFVVTKPIITSGRYKITNWSESEILYEKRPEFLSFIYPEKNFEKVRIAWAGLDMKDADLVSHYSSNTKLERNFEFFGPPPSGILYLDCLNYEISSSPFFKKEFRIIFREALYRELIKMGTSVTRSYFPLSMAGISEFKAPLPLFEGGTNIDKKLLRLTRPILVRLRPSVLSALPQLPEALLNTGKSIGVEVIIGNPISSGEVHSILNLDDKNIDLIGVLTGVLIKNPHSDIRFMFKSKEGIRLPDETGAIRKIVEQNSFEPQKVNKLIYEQSIVWPIQHPTHGYWAKPVVDMSKINTLMPPTDFSWVTKN